MRERHTVIDVDPVAAASAHAQRRAVAGVRGGLLVFETQTVDVRDYGVERARGTVVRVTPAGAAAAATRRRRGTLKALSSA